MEQLIMNWTRGSAAEPLEVALPEGFSFRRFDGSAADIDAWLEIVQYGLTDGKGDRTVFRKIMEEYPGYDPEGICFIEKTACPVRRLPFSVILQSGTGTFIWFARLPGRAAAESERRLPDLRSTHCWSAGWKRRI